MILGLLKDLRPRTILRLAFDLVLVKRVVKEV